MIWNWCGYYLSIFDNYNFSTTCYKHPLYMIYLEVFIWFDVINLSCHQLGIAKKQVEMCYNVILALKLTYWLNEKFTGELNNFWNPNFN